MEGPGSQARVGAAATWTSLFEESEGGAAKGGVPTPPLSPVELIVDCRERLSLPGESTEGHKESLTMRAYIEGVTGVIAREARLEVGDYAYVDRTTGTFLWIVERKTRGDLLSSFAGGLWAKERLGLNKSEIPWALLVENVPPLGSGWVDEEEEGYGGDVLVDPDHSTIPWSTITSGLRRMAVRDGRPIIWSEGPERTAQLLGIEFMGTVTRLLASQDIGPSAVDPDPRVQYLNAVPVPGRKGGQDWQTTMMGMLRAVAGVSPERAAALGEAFEWSWGAIIQASLGDLAGVQLGSGKRKLGPKVGSRLHAALHQGVIPEAPPKKRRRKTPKGGDCETDEARGNSEVIDIPGVDEEAEEEVFSSVSSTVSFSSGGGESRWSQASDSSGES